jgi:glutamine amidotransferase
MRLGIIDVGIGNIGSLQGALYYQGWDSERVTSSQDVRGFSHLILPGVGTFYEGMRRLRDFYMVEVIKDHANQGKPLMGICLGMQLLSDYGSEGGGRSGLGLIPGRVDRFDLPKTYRLPHVGWNSVDFKNNHPIVASVKVGVDFYFVHSYRFVTEDSVYTIASTNYGEDFSSIVANRNVIGFQFHPEKSQKNGLKILDNFCNWDGHA